MSTCSYCNHPISVGEANGLIYCPHCGARVVQKGFGRAVLRILGAVILCVIALILGGAGAVIAFVGAACAGNGPDNGVPIITLGLIMIGGAVGLVVAVVQLLKS